MTKSKHPERTRIYSFQKYTLSGFLDYPDEDILPAMQIDMYGWKRISGYLCEGEYLSELSRISQRIFIQFIILSDGLHLNSRTSEYWKYGDPSV